jgi:hypothetical protein
MIEAKVNGIPYSMAAKSCSQASIETMQTKAILFVNHFGRFK